MRSLAVLACALLLVGCVNQSLIAPVRPPTGWIFTGYSAPLTTKFHATPKGSKTGTSSTIYFEVPLSLVNPTLQNPDFAFGNAAVQQAAKNGGITTIYYVDYHFMTVLGLFAKTTVTVHGD